MKAFYVYWVQIRRESERQGEGLFVSDKIRVRPTGQRHSEKGDHPNVLRLVDGQRRKLSNPVGGFLINEHSACKAEECQLAIVRAD